MSAYGLEQRGPQVGVIAKREHEAQRYGLFPGLRSDPNYNRS